MDAETIQACIDEIDKNIVTGQLPGNGLDKTAQRNGLILAHNLLMKMLDDYDSRIGS